MGKQPFHVIIFEEMSYPEQLAFIIKEVFRSVLAFDKVLDIDLRETLTNYSAYKFVISSGDVTNKDTNSILERDFQKSKYREVILELDKKELERKICLNPPPEAHSALNNVIIPILELKNNELENVNDINQIESMRVITKKFIIDVSKSRICFLFVGKRRADEYLNYVENNITMYKGILCCARGGQIKVCEVMQKPIQNIIKKFFGVDKLIVVNFEGYLSDENSQDVYHKYILTEWE